MPEEFIHPHVTYRDALLLLIIIADFEALLVGLLDDVGHVLPPKGAQDPEKEVAL